MTPTSDPLPVIPCPPAYHSYNSPSPSLNCCCKIERFPVEATAPPPLAPGTSWSQLHPSLQHRHVSSISPLTPADFRSVWLPAFFLHSSSSRASCHSFLLQLQVPRTFWAAACLSLRLVEPAGLSFTLPAHTSSLREGGISSSGCKPHSCSAAICFCPLPPRPRGLLPVLSPFSTQIPLSPSPLVHWTGGGRFLLPLSLLGSPLSFGAARLQAAPRRLLS